MLIKNIFGLAPLRGFVFGIMLVVHVATPGIAQAQETLMGDISFLSQWSAMLERFEAPLRSAAPVSFAVAEWRTEIQRLKKLSYQEQVRKVNDLLNKVPYVDDLGRYGLKGYWAATPERFLSEGGDCKDYALAKYASLRALGFSPEQLRIAVVMDKAKNIPHAVLIVNQGSDSYVLDNQERKIKPAVDKRRYHPLFSVNGESWWEYSG